MRTAMTAIAWLLVLASLISARAKVEGVFSLTEGDFDYLLTKHKRVFVQWYAPSCAECSALFPELTKVSNNLKSSGHETRLAQLDATAEKNLAGKWGISGPVLHYFVHGKLLASYDGPMSADAITKWLQKRERPHLSEVKAGETEQFLSQRLTVAGSADSFALLAHVRQNSPRHKAFLKSLGTIMDVLHDSDDINFGVVWLSADAPKTDTNLTMRRSSFLSPDLVDIDFDDTWSAADIASWVNTKSFPTLGRRFSAKYDPAVVRDLGWDGVVVMCLNGIEKNTSTSLIEQLTSLVTTYPRWKFTSCELSRLAEKDREKLLGVVNAKFTSFVSVRHGARKRYLLEGPNEEIESGLSTFLSQAHAGKLFSRYKSEPRLAKEVDEGVTQLTGHTFEEHVKNPNLDYFVFLTHSRCHHCKDLAPVWKKLAAEVAAKGWGAKGVIIASMDAERNECEDEIHEFPRLVLYLAVKADQKMKKKRLFKADRVESLAALPVSRLLDFLSGNAINLEGVEEEALEADIAKSTAKSKAKRKQKRQTEL